MSILKIQNKETGEWINIQTIKGDPGKDGINGKDGVNGKDGINGQDGAPGKDGVDGKDYILTEADKQEIASLVLAELPDSEEVEY